MKAMFRVVATLAVVAFAVLTFGFTASAQYAPTVDLAAGGGSLIGTGAVGDTVTVTITAADGTITTKTAVVDANGNYIISISDLPVGAYDATVESSTGETATVSFTRSATTNTGGGGKADPIDYGGPFGTAPPVSGQSALQAVGATPDPAGGTGTDGGGTGGGLAHTGSSTQLPVIAGVSLLGVGGLLILAARKRN